MKTDDTKGKYDVEDSTENAMEMLGKGYDHPSIVVEPPRRQTIRRGKKMIEVEEPAWVKFSTDFKSELAEIDEYSLKVFIYIGLSVNFNTGEACPGVRKIATDTGMNKDTVSKAIANLEEIGFLTIHRREGSSNVYKPTRYISIGTVRPERTPDSELSDGLPKLSDENAKLSDASRVKNAQLEELEEQETSSEKNFSFDEDLADIGWTIAKGQKVTKKQLYKQSTMKAFEDMLESQFKRFPLNWIAFDEKAKETFRRFVMALPEGQSLEKFVDWWMLDERRVSSPPYTLAIIMQRWPQAFPRKTDDTRPEYQLHIPDENKEKYVPNPNPKRPILHKQTE